MVFSSFDFIALFLPLVVCGYFLLGRIGHTFALYWLIAASLLFYSWWNVSYTAILIVSVLFNFMMGGFIRKHAGSGKGKLLLFAGIAANLGLLGYFKYADFFLEATNQLFGSDLPMRELILPLGISFFTFQAIAYLADCFKKEQVSDGFTSFALFMGFFPQLIAGPIVHHKEMMPQFADEKAARFNWDNVACGLFIFAVGLFKKVIIADTLALYATWGFDEAPFLTLPEAWLSVLCYTFQIYFDFSGYTDMAIGAALFFNIKLPQNFDSPYKAKNIRDFWRRWHITLSRFLRDYLYIPLGGNRDGIPRQVFAIAVTFLLGGLWHGASWNFVAWGGMHALALGLFVVWQKTGLRLPVVISWTVTFLFVCLSWVVFRATSWADAMKVYAGMVDTHSLFLYGGTPLFEATFLPFMLAGLMVLCALPNSNELLARFRPSCLWLIFTVTLALAAFFRIGDYSEFLYFRF